MKNFLTKREADYFLKLDIRGLKKKGYLSKLIGKRYKSIGLNIEDDFEYSGNSLLGCSINWVLSIKNLYMRLSYITNDGHSFDYKIKLASTPCSYGGIRYWFLCPKCDRRIGTLYLSGYFLCRYCLNLTYKSCNRYGIWKKIGVHRELEEPKTKFYKGSITRRCRRYLKESLKQIRRQELLYRYMTKETMTTTGTMKVLEYLYPKRWE